MAEAEQSDPIVGHPDCGDLKKNLKKYIPD
jgi:hypothetical protein